MNYVELNIEVADPIEREVLVAELGELPFESFVEEEGMLKAYIPAGALAECKEPVDKLLEERGISGARYIEIETQNWNAVWEAQFEPVDVEGKLVIRAPFHTPAGDVKEVIIMPKMSFGTGHHATTWLMSAEMLEHDFAGRRVLDVGTGTGVLAILAAKLGAERVDAIDIDEWAWKNARENAEANGVEVDVKMGDISVVRRGEYDIVLANINRNVLVAEMGTYAATLRGAGEVIVSGIFESDVEAIRRSGHEAGLRFESERIKDGWAVVAFKL